MLFNWCVINYLTCSAVTDVMICFKCNFIHMFVLLSLAKNLNPTWFCCFKKTKKKNNQRISELLGELSSTVGSRFAFPSLFLRSSVSLPVDSLLAVSVRYDAVQRLSHAVPHKQCRTVGFCPTDRKQPVNQHLLQLFFCSCTLKSPSCLLYLILLRGEGR